MNEVDLYQTFVDAEKFYYDKFWLGIIGVSLTLFFLWVMVLYANKKQKIISLILAMCYHSNGYLFRRKFFTASFYNTVDEPTNASCT